jgi:hypothetical protein
VRREETSCDMSDARWLLQECFRASCRRGWGPSKLHLTLAKSTAGLELASATEGSQPHCRRGRGAGAHGAGMSQMRGGGRGLQVLEEDCRLENVAGIEVWERRVRQGWWSHWGGGKEKESTHTAHACSICSRTLPTRARRGGDADGAGKCAERGAEETPVVGQAATIVETPTGSISPARKPRWDKGGERSKE